MVPKLNPYELVIKIMIDKVEIMKADKPPNESISQFQSDSHRRHSKCLIYRADNLIFIEELIEHRPLYKEQETEMPGYGAPRTVVLYHTIKTRG